MKILVVGDKESSYIWDHFDRERFRDVRLIISTGDLSADYLSFLVTMLNVPLLYVPGNHDESYLANPPEGCENIDGRIYRFGDITILGLGGSRRYKSGPFQYTERQMNWRVKKLAYALWRAKHVDILVSHAPADGVCDGKDLCHRGFPAFNAIIERFHPRYFIHGHQHMSYGSGPRVSDYRGTSVINSEGYYIFEY